MMGRQKVDQSQLFYLFNLDWELKTAIERAMDNWGLNRKHATTIEFQTIREFRRRLREPEHRRVHEDTLFCLALMQHHGAPTRLLDCTFSPFVAAAFAMQDGAAKANKPVVWCFNGHWGDEQAKRIAPNRLVERRNLDILRTDQTFIPLYQLHCSDPPDPTKRQFVKHENPFHLNERLTTQQGAFLCPADLESTFVDNLKAMQGWESAENLVRLRLTLSPPEAVKFAKNLKANERRFCGSVPRH
jgi:FRG domain